MNELLNITQGSSEWHALRKTKLGASDAPIIMGESPWKTPYQLWEEKIASEPKELITSSAMQRGNDLEPKARQFFAHVFGIEVTPSVMIHNKYPWMMASLDGISKDKKVMVEIKCPGEKDHNIALNGNIPIKYYPQLQHQMEVTGLNKCYYLSFDGEEGITILIERDDDYIKKMIEKEQAFWNCIEEKVAPELEERDYQERVDRSWLQTVIDWRLTRSLLKDYEEREKELRQRLIILADGTNSIGGGVKLSKVVRKGNIDYGAIPEMKSVNVDQYRKNSIETWRLDDHIIKINK